MENNWIAWLLTALVALISCAILTPLLIRWSPRLRLVDIPDERKLHKKPIPAIGGLVMVLSVCISFCLSQGLRQLMQQYWPLGVLMLVLCITGVLDDRLRLPAMMRLVIQLASAFFMARAGIRLQHLHGFLGMHEIPLLVQYALTMIIVAGVTNAFNLIDGIDGLAGSIALVNTLLFAVLFMLMGQKSWLFLLLPLAASIIVFIRFNWRPAKLFMGDGGSLVFGFLFAVLGIVALNVSMQHAVVYTPMVLVSVTASMMLPAMDTLRVFYIRLRQGRSPFSADKNHLHHLFIRQYLSHAQATARVIKVHVALVLLSLLLVQYVSITATVLLQVLAVVGYTKMLHLSLLFQRWYRFIKRLETA